MNTINCKMACLKNNAASFLNSKLENKKSAIKAAKGFRKGMEITTLIMYIAIAVGLMGVIYFIMKGFFPDIMAKVNSIMGMES